VKIATVAATRESDRQTDRRTCAGDLIPHSMLYSSSGTDNNSKDMFYGAIVTAQWLREFTRFIRWTQNSARR